MFNIILPISCEIFAKYLLYVQYNLTKFCEIFAKSLANP